MADEDEENEILVCKTSEELDRLQKEVMFREFVMHFLESRSICGVKMLHSILEEIEPLRMRELKQIYVRPDWSKYEASEHWSWDSEKETLKVNTSIFVR
ncbi:hypothetical protein FSP39_014884 [Pinctada imbricata]|uniref:Uncharacterized protein n=1 Tax=Pinctada imbricata TaxID=66713 RepID=A0AA88XLM2_PINIB|nr:hypothetical protein FSP39_014884 [Pinctada imbricata]